MTLKRFKEILIKHYHTTKQKNCIGSVEKVVEELFTGIDDDFLITSICQQEIDEACKKQREICANKVNWIDADHSLGVYNSILNAPSPKGDKKYYCKDCGTEMDEGEAKTFTCCEICWDKHYKSPSPKESE